MIQITPHIKIYLCREAVDFRKGIDGLAGVCRKQLSKDPFCGSMFIFRNKRQTTLKILLYDGQGFWLFIKRLSKGRFKWWPNPNPKTIEPVRTVRGVRAVSPQEPSNSNKVLNLNAAELHLLLWNGNPSRAQIGCEWKKINA
jgi:hypothetical protein